MKRLKVIPVLVLSTVLVSACSPLSKASLDSIKLAFQGQSLKLDETTLAPNVAYLRAIVPGSEAIMARGFSDSGRETWYTASGQVLTLVDGLVVGSVGLPENLNELTSEPAGQGATLAQQSLPISYRKFIERLPEHSGEVTSYRLENNGTERISVWGHELLTQRLQEVILTSNSAEPLSGNTYWLTTDTHELVQSRQWLSPEYPIILQPRLVPVQKTIASVKPVERYLLNPTNTAPALSTPIKSGINQAASILVLTEPTRLSQLLLNFPLPEGAYAPASAWLARSALPAQQVLKNRILFDLDQAIANKRIQPAQQLRVKQLREQIAAMPVTGRMPLSSVNARWLQANPAADVWLNGGDQFYRLLQRPQQAWVLGGDSSTPCAVTLAPKQTVVSALKACLPHSGLWGYRLPDTAYRITPDTQVLAIDVALWNRAPARAVPPGTTLWVPVSGLAELSGNGAIDADIATWLATQKVSDTQGVLSP